LILVTKEKIDEIVVVSAILIDEDIIDSIRDTTDIYEEDDAKLEPVLHVSE
jgi:hypothetical protein